MFDVAGTLLRQWGTEGSGEGQLDYPYGLTVSGGEVYVCDSGNNRVVVFGLDGSFVRQWGTQGSGGQFYHPRVVVVNGDEVIVAEYVNHRVQVFGLDGSFVRQWGSRGYGAGQFVQPYGVAVSEGEVFVGCKHRIQVFQ